MIGRFTDKVQSGIQHQTMLLSILFSISYSLALKNDNIEERRVLSKSGLEIRFKPGVIPEDDINAIVTISGKSEDEEGNEYGFSKELNLNTKYGKDPTSQYSAIYKIIVPYNAPYIYLDIVSKDNTMLCHSRAKVQRGAYRDIAIFQGCDATHYEVAQSSITNSEAFQYPVTQLGAI